MLLVKANKSATCIKTQKPNSYFVGKHWLLWNSWINFPNHVALQRISTARWLNRHNQHRCSIRFTDEADLGKLASCSLVLCRHSLFAVYTLLRYSHRCSCSHNHDSLRGIDLDIHRYRCSEPQKQRKLTNFSQFSFRSQTLTSSSASINC